MTFYERYEGCCKEAGIPPQSQAAAEYLGCTKANITILSKSGITPKGDIVAGAARMLNVSADYFLGLIESPKPIDNSLSFEEMDLIKRIRELNEEGRNAAIGMIKGLGMQEEYKKDNRYELNKKKA